MPSSKSLGFVKSPKLIKVFKQVEAKRRLEQKKVDKTIATEEQIDTKDVEQVKSENKKVATAPQDKAATYAKHAGLEDFKQKMRAKATAVEKPKAGPNPTSTEEPVADVSAYKADVSAGDTKGVVTNLAKTPATALVATLPSLSTPLEQADAQESAGAEKNLPPSMRLFKGIKSWPHQKTPSRPKTSNSPNHN